MSLDPGTLGAINTFALAAIVVLLITGWLVAKPAHDFVVRLLSESHGREAALEKELGRQTDTIASMSDRLEKLNTTIDGLRNQLMRREA